MNKVKPIQQKQLIEIMQEPQSAQIAMLQHATQLALMLVNQILEEQVQCYTGERYSQYPVRIPRLRSRETQKTLPLPVWEDIKSGSGADQLLLERLLLGISTRDYEKVVQETGEGFGVSKSNMSKQFISQAVEVCKEFKSRSLNQRYVAVFIDGKHLMGHQVVIAMGVTEAGEKQILDFIQTSTENARAVRQLLVGLNHRGLGYQEGLLFIIDGAKGLRTAIDAVYGHKAIVQRCIWHKQENVLSYLNEEQRAEFKSRLQNCYRETSYRKAKAALQEIIEQLNELNPGASRSLQEGLEETLTLHKLGLVRPFRQSLSTTNCIENVNRMVQQRTGKIKHWVNGRQIERWMTLGLLDIENRLNKIHNYKHLNLLITKLKEITKTKRSYQLLLIEDKAAALSSTNKMSTKKRA